MTASLFLRLERWTTGHNRARFQAVLDQGFQGLANVLTLVVLGRSLPADEFGAIGLMLGLYFFVMGFHRSAVVLPYITEHLNNDSRRYHSAWWWLSVIASLIMAALLVAVAGVLHYLAIGQARWLLEPLLLSALITPPMVAAEFVRRWLYKIERAGRAATLSIVFFVVLMTAALLAGRFEPDARTAALAWVAASLAAVIYALPHVRPMAPDSARMAECLERNREFSFWLALTNLPYAVYSSATVVIPIGILSGPTAAGVFTAARTLTNPATSIVSAVDSVDKPKAARAFARGDLAALRHVIARTRRLLIVATGAYLGLIALVAPPLIHLVFHGRFVGIETEVRLLCLAFFLFCLNQPSETLLIVMRESVALFVTRLITAVLTIAALVIGKGWAIEGMVGAIAISQFANLALLIAAERIAVSRYAAREGESATA